LNCGALSRSQPERPGVACVDLVIDAPERVPGRHVIGRRIAELRAGRERGRLVPLLHEPLDAGEEVELVAHDRPADGAAPLLLAGLRFLRVVDLGEVVLRGDRAAREEIEGGAHDLVGARLRDRVDHRARRAAELRVELVREHLDFLNRLVGGARLAADIRPPQVVHVGGAVEDDVVGRRRLPVGEHGVVQEPGSGHELGARHVADKRHIAAVPGRQLGKFLRRDVPADLGRRQVDQRRGGRHHHGFLKGADIQRQVERLRHADREHHVPAIEPAEALQLRHDPVAPRRHLRDEIAAIGGRDSLAKHAGFLVRDDDGDTGQDAALLIRHLAPQLRGPGLATSRSRGHAQRHAQNPDEHCSLVHLPLPEVSCQRRVC
jgi:hypothetical protein